MKANRNFIRSIGGVDRMLILTAASLLGGQMQNPFVVGDTTIGKQRAREILLHDIAFSISVLGEDRVCNILGKGKVDELLSINKNETAFKKMLPLGETAIS